MLVGKEHIHRDIFDACW